MEAQVAWTLFLLFILVSVLWGPDDPRDGCV
jgi:hypothetical protein